MLSLCLRLVCYAALDDENDAQKMAFGGITSAWMGTVSNSRGEP